MLKITHQFIICFIESIYNKGSTTFFIPKQLNSLCLKRFPTRTSNNDQLSSIKNRCDSKHSIKRAAVLNISDFNSIKFQWFPPNKAERHFFYSKDYYPSGRRTLIIKNKFSGCIIYKSDLIFRSYFSWTKEI